MIIITAQKKENNLEDITEILADIKRELKDNEIVHEICKEHGFDIDIIDGITLEFVDDLEASAKTVDSRIQLSSDLLQEEFEIMMRYAIHELVHSLQHMRSEGIDPYATDEYLDREDELEAFQFQIAYDSEERGEEEALEYVEELIEYHEIPEEEKEDKKEELLDKI